MAKTIRFRLAARCDAAGRPNNEDNFQVDADLSTENWQFKKDEVQILGSKGALLLVCDGMGGMNAGEVASKIAVDTVKYRFSKDSLTSLVLDTDEQRYDFIRQVIQEADTNIKKESSADAAKSGMGSTIVLAWLIDGKVYVGWCGDSRAYKYNPQYGLMQLSHDHSYVQELVDSGKLSPELAFDHPNSNVITRSLGDPRGVAQPDVKSYPLEENDVILLCSDGLCGVLRDQVIERVIEGNLNSMVSCLDALWETAKNSGWHDNVTIALAQIMSHGDSSTAAKPIEYKQEEPNLVTPKPIKKTKLWDKKYFKVCCAAVAVLLAVLTLVIILLGRGSNNQQQNVNQSNPAELCEQLSQTINASFFQKDFNPLEHPEVLKDVMDHIDAVNNCPDLAKEIMELAEKQQEGIKNKISSKALDKEDADDVLKELSRIVESLKE